MCARVCIYIYTNRSLCRADPIPSRPQQWQQQQRMPCPGLLWTTIGTTINRGLFQHGRVPDSEAVPRTNKSFWLLRSFPPGLPEEGIGRGVRSLASNEAGRLSYATSAYAGGPGAVWSAVRVTGCRLYARPAHHSDLSLPQNNLFEI